MKNRNKDLEKNSTYSGAVGNSVIAPLADNTLNQESRFCQTQQSLLLGGLNKNISRIHKFLRGGKKWKRALNASIILSCLSYSNVFAASYTDDWVYINADNNNIVTYEKSTNPMATPSFAYSVYPSFNTVSKQITISGYRDGSYIGANGQTSSSRHDVIWGGKSSSRALDGYSLILNNLTDKGGAVGGSSSLIFRSAETNTGNVSNNLLSIGNVSLYNSDYFYGATTNNGNALNNQTIINGLFVSEKSDDNTSLPCFADIANASSTNLSSGNSIIIHNATVNGSISLTAANGRGGSTTCAQATNNQIIINNGSFNTITGMVAKGLSTENNKLIINGGTFSGTTSFSVVGAGQESADRGKPLYANMKQNNLTISGGTLYNSSATIRLGYYAPRYGRTFDGSFENNEIIINKNIANGKNFSLIGIYAQGVATSQTAINNGKIANNVVTIKQDSPTTNFLLTSFIGTPTKGTGTIENNKVILYNGVSTNQITLGNISHTLPENNKGNEVIVNGDNKIERLNYVNKITLDESIIFTNGGKALSANIFNDSIPLEIDITKTDFLSTENQGQYTILSGTKNLDALSIKYSDITSSTGKTYSFYKTNSFIGEKYIRVGEVQNSLYNNINIENRAAHKIYSDENSFYYVTNNLPNISTKISLLDIDWSKNATSREVISSDNVVFDDETTVDESSLSFTNPQEISSGESMTLLSGASGLPAAAAVAHTQAITDYATSNGTTVNATLNGTITRPANTIGYTVGSIKISDADIKNWDGETTSVLPSGWTAKTGGVAVDTNDFSHPILAVGEYLDILSSANAIFSDSVITGTNKYSETAITNDAANGVSFSGTHLGGVKTTNANKNLTYFETTDSINTIDFGNMTMGSARNASGGIYDFRNVSSISANNLTFTNPEAASGSVALLTGATNLADDLIADHSQDFDKTLANGTVISSTLHGTLSTKDEAVSYAISDRTANTIDLSNWDGTASLAPDSTISGANVSVTTGDFTTPTTAVGETQTIMTSTQNGFFGEVTGAHAYEEHDITDDESEGITFAGQHREGVKVENDGKLLNYYATTDDIHNITLGEMSWGTNRALSNTNYDFRNAAIDASNLTFSNVGEVTGTTTLLSDATNLSANKEITGAAHSQDFNTASANGAVLSSTLHGTLLTTAGNINYTASDTTVNNISLANWDGTANSIADHWTASGTTVDTGNFAAPTTLGTHETQDILTTAKEGFFSDESISGARAYSEEDITEDVSQGVSYNGLHFEGVKTTDSGKKLTYFADTKDIYNISLGEMTWGTGRTTNTGYDFRNLESVNATDLTFTNPYDVNGTMLLIGNAANLASTTAITGSSHAQNFSYTRGGAKFDATLNGTVEAETNTIKYTKTNATINNIDLSEWDGTTPLELPEGAAADGVEIDTGTFTPPTLTPGTSSDVITTDVEGFFSDDKISGDEKYQERDFSDDGGLTDKGVSFSGKQDSGYKSSDNGKKLIYDTTEKRVEEVMLGELKGNEAVSAPTGYDFTNTDTIDATGFTFENPADVSGTKDIFTGVTGLADGTAINGANHSQDYDKTEGNGAKLSETLKGTISAANEKIQYTKTDEILNGVNLSGWDGTNKNITGKTAKENGVDILTSGFDVPALGVNESQDILTSDSDIFSGANITGSHAYTNEALENDTANGVLLDGSHYGGVKASDDGKKLSYFAETNNITDITLGEMTWGVSRTADSSYDFRDVGTISADNLRFTNAQDADGTMELLKNAQNLNPSATITGTPHSQDFTYSKGGATFNGTLTGTVALDGTSVKYTRTGTTLKNVDLSGWDGTTDIDTPSDWTKEAGTPSVEIDTGTMDSPDVGPGQTKEIITTGTEGTFSDDDIKGDEKYHTRELKNEKVNGVDFSGTQDRGFKTADNGKKLVYEADEKKVEQITLTDFDKGEGTRTAPAGYDFTNTDKVDATGLAFKDPENVNAPVTILDGATNLPNGTTVDGADHTQEFEKGLTNGIDMKVDLKGNVTVQDEKVTYTPTAKDVKEVDVSGWNGENTSNVPDGWTGTDTKIKADTIDGSKVTDNDKKDILVSETAIFNDDNITGDQKYQERNRSEEKNGIGFGGTQESGVKTDDGGKKLVYQKSEYNVKEITLKDVDKAGNAIPFAAPAGYDFSETAKINGENLNFADPEHVEGNVDILTGATGLQDGVIVSGGDDHKQAFNKELENGINLGVNLEGTISAKDEKVVFETTGKDVTSVDLKAWNGETTAQTPDGWTGKDVKVKTDGLSDANIKDGESKDILTSGGEAIFKDESISGEQKYGRHGREEAGSGVILSGSQNKGVKTSEDHTKLVYEKGLFEVANIGVKDFEFGKPMEITANYDFSNADVDPKNVSFRKPEEIAAGSFTVILKANETLADINKEAKAEYSAAPVAGVSVDATLAGKFKSEGDTLSYTAESNRASQLTFGDVEWLDSRPLIDHTTTMKNVSFEGANVDTTKINFTNIQAMEASRRMTLVKDFGATIGNIEGTEYTVGSVYKGKGVASLEGKDLVFTAQTGTEKMQEQTHNTLMGAEAAVASLSAGDEFIKNATNEIGNPANIGADGVSIYAKMGVNSMRQETGSHIKANTWNAILSVGKQKKFSDSTLDYGFFYEHGQGNYTAYNGDLRGDGNITYNGGGLLAKWKKNDGFYVDGSLRIGRLKDKSNNMLVDMYGRGYSYETDAPYFGGHIGVGKEFDVGHGNAVDVYAKYTYGQRNAVSFDAGGHYELDAVRSQVFSIGARYLMKRDKWNFYGGLAYEHELDGRATGRVTAPGAATSEAIRSASTAGGSIKAEIGASMKPDEDSPWSLDLNVAGFAGQKQGVQGSVSVSLAF